MHAGPQSLFDYCSDLLRRGQHEFKCATCDAVWYYSTVRLVACLTTDERRDFERLLSENKLKKEQGMKQCGGCLRWCCRADEQRGDMIKCLVCTETKGYAYYFCWKCLREWVDRPDGKCGNANCSGSNADQLRTLESCPMKLIDGFNVPSVRACPKCCALIEHASGCRRMPCTTCSFQFCVVCLKEFKVERLPPPPGYCSYFGCSGVVPRQVLSSARNSVGVEAAANVANHVVPQANAECVVL